MAIITFFGTPGSGKTTFAAQIVAKNLKRGIKTYSNVPIVGSVLFDKEELGISEISDGEIIIDEAGVDFNSRAYKSLPQATIKYLKYYRHFGIRNIYIFSQSYDDMDITLRRLSDRLYLVRPSPLPHIYTAILISQRIGIDKDSHQIMDMYRFHIFRLRLVCGLRYYHLFDSWSRYDLKRRHDQFYGINADCLADAQKRIKYFIRPRLPKFLRKK